MYACVYVCVWFQTSMCVNLSVCLYVCACIGSVTCDCVSMYVLARLSVCLSVTVCGVGLWFPCDCVYGVCDFHVCVFVCCLCLCPCLFVYVYISDYLCNSQYIVSCNVHITNLFLFLHRESHNQYFEVSQSIIHYIIIDYTIDDGLL